MSSRTHGSETRPVVLCIGGIDPTGRAGLAADIRAGEAAGVHVAPVVATLTVQNGAGFDRKEEVHPVLFRDQIAAVLDDLPVKAVKTGALGVILFADLLDEELRKRGLAPPLVVDPVLKASNSGTLTADLQNPNSWRGLFRRAALITPNLFEAAYLLGRQEAENEDELRRQALALAERYHCAVLLKGGHLKRGASVVDVLAAPDGEQRTFVSPRQPKGSELRGTGCTLATLIAAYLAQGQELAAAVARARARLLEGLRQVVEIGGAGPPPVRPPLKQCLKGSDNHSLIQSLGGKTGESDS